MGAVIIVASWILMLPTSVRPVGVYVGPSDSGAQATWPIREAVADQAQPFAFTRVGLGPFIDMDNRRQDEDREKRRAEKLQQEAQRDEELRAHYRNYGYTYPPFIYADPRLGPYSRDPSTGRYYNYGTRYYYNPDTGQYYDINKNNNSRRVQISDRGEVICERILQSQL